MQGPGLGVVDKAIAFVGNAVAELLDLTRDLFEPLGVHRWDGQSERKGDGETSAYSIHGDLFLPEHIMLPDR